MSRPVTARAYEACSVHEAFDKLEAENILLEMAGLLNLLRLAARGIETVQSGDAGALEVLSELGCARVASLQTLIFGPSYHGVQP